MSDKPTERETEEHRKSARKALLSNAIFIALDVTSKSALTIDLSEGGISLTLPQSMNIGQACAISFDTPSQQDKQRTVVRGSVVSCTPKDNDRFRIGIHFIHSDLVSKKLIKEAVTNYLQVAV